MSLDQRDEVADVTRSLTEDLEDAFDDSPDCVEWSQQSHRLQKTADPFLDKLELEGPPQTDLLQESTVETEHLMSAIRAGQRERLAVME